MGQLAPDLHRDLRRFHVTDNLVTVELSIQGTVTGPFPTPACVIQPSGAKLDIPTADFWYIEDGKIKEFNCYVGVASCSPSSACSRTSPPPSPPRPPRGADRPSRPRKGVRDRAPPSYPYPDARDKAPARPRTETAPVIDVRRADHRSQTDLSWLRGRHWKL